MTNTLIKALLFAYIAILLSSLWEGRYIMALYWFGAAVLNLAVLIMGGVE